jgi:hypothetical protein
VPGLGREPGSPSTTYPDSTSPVIRRVVRFQVATLRRDDFTIETPSKNTGAKFNHFWSVKSPFVSSSRHRYSVRCAHHEAKLCSGLVWWGVSAADACGSRGRPVLRCFEK